MERLEKENPDFIGSRYPGGVALCPEDCGYEKRSPCEAMAGGSFDPSACMRCWNRQADAAGGGEREPGGDAEEKGGGDGGGQDH